VLRTAVGEDCPLLLVGSPPFGFVRSLFSPSLLGPLYRPILFFFPRCSTMSPIRLDLSLYFLLFLSPDQIDFFTVSFFFLFGFAIRCALFFRTLLSALSSRRSRTSPHRRKSRRRFRELMDCVPPRRFALPRSASLPLVITALLFDVRHSEACFFLLSSFLHPPVRPLLDGLLSASIPLAFLNAPGFFFSNGLLDGYTPSSGPDH